MLLNNLQHQAAMYSLRSDLLDVAIAHCTFYRKVHPTIKTFQTWPAMEESNSESFVLPAAVAPPQCSVAPLADGGLQQG